MKKFELYTDEMIEMLDQLSMESFGRTYTEAMENDICVKCGNSIDVTDPPLNYELDGICRECSDRAYRRADCLRGLPQAQSISRTVHTRYLSVFEPTRYRNPGR